VAELFGVEAVRISGMGSPYRAGFCPLPGLVLDVALDGSFAYVAADQAGLYVLRVEMATPTPTPTRTASATATVTRSATPTRTASATATATVSQTATPTATGSMVPGRPVYLPVVMRPIVQR